MWSMIGLLYEKTKNKPYFTVEDFRELKLHEDMHPNAIGQFFKSLSDSKRIEQCGITKTTHVSANRRWVFKWKWSDASIETIKKEKEQ